MLDKQVTDLDWGVLSPHCQLSRQGKECRRFLFRVIVEADKGQRLSTDVGHCASGEAGR